jgi:aminobenzoyl-glutamate utilization protein B
VQAARTYFTDVQMKADKPLDFLAATDAPHIELNRDTMARYRPEMRKHYYDASRYDTYLDQLGVKFPAMAKGQ